VFKTAHIDIHITPVILKQDGSRYNAFGTLDFLKEVVQSLIPINVWIRRIKYAEDPILDLFVLEDLESHVSVGKAVSRVTLEEDFSYCGVYTDTPPVSLGLNYTNIEHEEIDVPVESYFQIKFLNDIDLVSSPRPWYTFKKGGVDIPVRVVRVNCKLFRVYPLEYMDYSTLYEFRVREGLKDTYNNTMPGSPFCVSVDFTTIGQVLELKTRDAVSLVDAGELAIFTDDVMELTLYDNTAIEKVVTTNEVAVSASIYTPEARALAGSNLYTLLWIKNPYEIHGAGFNNTDRKDPRCVPYVTVAGVKRLSKNFTVSFEHEPEPFQPGTFCYARQSTTVLEPFEENSPLGYLTDFKEDYSGVNEAVYVTSTLLQLSGSPDDNNHVLLTVGYGLRKVNGVSEAYIYAHLVFTGLTLGTGVPHDPEDCVWQAEELVTESLFSGDTERGLELYHRMIRDSASGTSPFASTGLHHAGMPLNFGIHWSSQESAFYIKHALTVGIKEGTDYERLYDHEYKLQFSNNDVLTRLSVIDQFTDPITKVRILGTVTPFLLPIQYNGYNNAVVSSLGKIKNIFVEQDEKAFYPMYTHTDVDSTPENALHQNILDAGDIAQIVKDPDEYNPEVVELTATHNLDDEWEVPGETHKQKLVIMFTEAVDYEFSKQNIDMLTSSQVWAEVAPGEAHAGTKLALTFRLRGGGLTVENPQHPYTVMGNKDTRLRPNMMFEMVGFRGAWGYPWYPGGDLHQDAFPGVNYGFLKCNLHLVNIPMAFGEDYSGVIEFYAQGWTDGEPG